MVAMPLRREPRLAVAVALVATGALCGCGKANLVRGPAREAAARSAGGAGAARGRAETPTPGPAPRRPPEAVPVPLPLTPARADAFAAAVSLAPADVPGASVSKRTSTPRSEEQEAAGCGARGAVAVGGGRSPNLQRGRGLDRESISSGVDVLTGAAAVQSDLAYAASSAGLACYAKVLGRSLRREESADARLLGVHVGHLGLDVGAGRASGIRITARVGIPGSGVQVRLFVDALSLAYGPAELDLYTTSFVQPVAATTQRELLTLLRERARLHEL